MKKIIATVLAMVMALALCTTAFAAPVAGYTGYTRGGEKLMANATDAESFSVEAHEAAFNKATGAGNVAYYTVSNATDANTAYNGDYTKADKTDFDLQLTKSGASTLYLKHVNPGAVYVAKVEAFTKIGDKCGQLDVDADGTYYVNTSKYTSDNGTKDAGEAYFVASDAESAVYVLLNGKLVSVTLAGEQTLVGHTWVAVEKDGKVVSYKCSDCGTVASIYKTYAAAKASGLKNVEAFVNDDGETIYLAYTDGKTDTTKPTDTNKSPKTFDAGIAMYVGMALTSVAGSAVVIGKKKEF